MSEDRLEQIDQQIIALHLQQRHLRKIEHELFEEKMEIIRNLGNRAVEIIVEIVDEES